MFILIWATLFLKVMNISSSSDLSEKPTLTIPPLTEGEETTLTCTAPDPCSDPESAPVFTWMWAGPGENSSDITRNKSKNQGLNSTLTFSPSAKHHGSEVTCQVSCTNHTSVEATATLNVTFPKRFEIIGDRLVMEGRSLNLSCSFDRLPPPFIAWTKPGFNTSLMNGTGSAILFISNITMEHSGEYICTAEHLNATLTHKVDVKVKYVKKPTITGETTVKEGETLTLTCTAESFPPSLIMWTYNNITQTVSNETEPDSGTSALVVYNVTTENSGQYSCRTKYLNSSMQNIDLTVIIQKKLKISGERAIMEGHSLNLSCSFDSFPQSSITWTKPGFNVSLMNGTGSATLFISNMTTEHSGQYTCTAERLNDTLREYVDVEVKYVRKLKIAGETTVKEGDSLNLTCSVDSFPPSVITWTKGNKTLSDKTGPETGKSSILIHNVTTEHSGQYFCYAKYLNILMQDINITVMYQRSLRITGETALTEGQVLNLTCSVDSWPLSFITWIKPGSDSENSTGAATLLIYSVSAEHSGRYSCTAKYLNTTLREDVNIEMKMLPRILNESGCEAQLDLLTCVCISQGFPLPRIQWLLLENQTEYSLNTAVSNHTVKSTVILSEKQPSSGSAVCVSSNGNGETKRNLIINKVNKEGQFVKILRFVTQPGTIVPFLIGLLLSALIFCTWRRCCRKEQKPNGDPAGALEMVMMSQENLLMNGGQGEEYEQLPGQGAQGAQGAEGGRLDVEYSDIKLLFGKKQSAGKNRKQNVNSDTEYAKIKPKQAKSKVNGGDGEEEELQLCAREVEGGENVAVYSNVSELMEQI